MENFPALKDGEYYFIAVACSSEGEYTEESCHNILCQFHRVMGNFVDAEGHTSQSPIEWFESVEKHEHFSHALSVRQAYFCKKDGKVCSYGGRKCRIDGQKYAMKNGHRCYENWESGEMARAGVPLNFEGAERLIFRRGCDPIW